MSFFFTLLAACLFSAPDVSAALTDNQSSYQTAFLYFLPDYQPKQVDEAEVRGCRKLGYTFTRSNCTAPRILKDKCPAGNAYKTCFCAGLPTCTGSASAACPFSTTTGASRTSCVNCLGNTLYTWTCARTCSADISSKPANSTYTTCTDCTGTHNVGWSCNSGYRIEGGTCVCATPCSDSVTTKPENSYYITTSCNACGVVSTIKTGWACNANFHKSGNSCVPNCVPKAAASGCTYGTVSCSDGCGGTTTCCKACTPKAAATGCTYGTESCSNGCGGTTTCCKPPLAYILYSDKTYSKDIISGKTPIGVVFNVEKRLAIALEDSAKKWSTDWFEVPGVTNYVSSYEAKNDWSGRANTTTVINYCSANGKTCPAFDYVNSYSTAGTNAGDWYLPAAGELNDIYRNKEAINNTLDLIRNRLSSYLALLSGDYWSSSEYIDYTACGQSFYSGNVGGNNKDHNSYYVRPVLAF